MGLTPDLLGRYGDRLRLLPDEAVELATRELRTAALAQLKRDTGGDRKLSGLRNGRPLTVRVTKRGRELVEGRIMAGPKSQRAPWFWLEEGTRAGPRGRPFGRGTNPNTRRADRGNHPGTPAKGTWTKAFESTAPRVQSDIQALFDRVFQD